MTHPTHTEEQIRAKIDELIDKATRYDLDSLDTIYHDDLHIVTVDHEDNVGIYDKARFKEKSSGKRSNEYLGQVPSYPYPG